MEKGEVLQLERSCPIIQKRIQWVKALISSSGPFAKRRTVYIFVYTTKSVFYI